MADLKLTTVDGELIIQESGSSTLKISTDSTNPTFKFLDANDVEYLIVQTLDSMIDLSGFQTIHGRNVTTPLHKDLQFTLSSPDYQSLLNTFFTEAEDATGATNNSSSSSSYSPERDQSGTGAYIPCTSQNDQVYNQWTGGPSNDLPYRTYKLVVRFHSSTKVSNDLGLRVRNTTGGKDLLNETYTTKDSVFQRLVSSPFTITPADAGDTIEARIRKETASANTINVDFLYLMPVTPRYSVKRDLSGDVQFKSSPVQTLSSSSVTGSPTLTTPAGTFGQFNKASLTGNVNGSIKAQLRNASTTKTLVSTVATTTGKTSSITMSFTGSDTLILSFNVTAGSATATLKHYPEDKVVEYG